MAQLGESKGIWGLIEKNWHLVITIISVSCALWFTVQNHSKAIDELKAADIEIRNEIKELRAENTATNKVVAESLLDIRLKLQEIVTTVKLDRQDKQSEVKGGGR